MGTQGPEILHQFLLEQALWQRLGLTRETAKLRPHRELDEYALIITLIQQEEARKRG